MHGGQGPDVVEWIPVPHTQWIVVPTLMVEVLFPLTSSMNWVPPCEVTVTFRVTPTGGVGVLVGPPGVLVGVGGVGVRVCVGETPKGVWVADGKGVIGSGG